jgi:hypothetical protein
MDKKDDTVDELFAGKQPEVRAIYERLLETAKH